MAKKPKFSVEPEEYVEVQYDVLEAKMGVVEKACDRCNVQWRAADQIESRPGRVEWSGIVYGSRKNVLKFLRGAYGKGAEQHLKDYQLV
jgi:hypothetical protein